MKNYSTQLVHGTDGYRIYYNSREIFQKTWSSLWKLHLFKLPAWQLLWKLLVFRKYLHDLEAAKQACTT